MWTSGLVKAPKMTKDDYLKLAPVGAAFAAGQVATVASLGAVAVSFTHVVKALEPAVNAIASALILGQVFHPMVYASLLPVFAGVALASSKELSFTMFGFLTAMASNFFFVTRNVLATKFGDVGDMGEDKTQRKTNQLAVLTGVATLVLLPVVVLLPGGLTSVPTAWKAALATGVAPSKLWYMLVASGFYFFMTRSCQVQDALRVEILISPPERYPANVRICSQPVSKGKTGEGFRARLIVVPNIPELVAVLHIAAPDDVKNSWICTNLMVTLSVCKAKDLDFKISRSRVEKVCKDRPVTGLFRGLLKCSDMIDRDQGWLNDKGELQVQAEIRGLPSFTPTVDFSQELKVVTFRLAGDRCLYFDRRVLMGQSEYFREMLATSVWQESQTGEIDLSKDPQCTVSALLEYMTTNSFEANGNTDLAFVVRILADRYQLRQLVEEVDSQLESQLNRENVLSFFGRLIGTNSLLEAKCLKMLELDGQRILEQQEATLDQITEERSDRQQYQLSSFWVLSCVPPITHSVLNTLKRVVIIVVSIIVFRTPVTPQSAAGTAIAIGGVLLYSLTKAHYAKKK
eukprot:s2474_g5.t2